MFHLEYLELAFKGCLRQPIRLNYCYDLNVISILNFMCWKLGSQCSYVVMVEPLKGEACWKAIKSLEALPLEGTNADLEEWIGSHKSEFFI